MAICFCASYSVFVCVQNLMWYLAKTSSTIYKKFVHILNKTTLTLDFVLLGIKKWPNHISIAKQMAYNITKKQLL